VAFLSISLALIGMILSYFIYKPGTKYTSEYEEKSVPDTMIGKLSYSAFYLDSIYENIVSPAYLFLSRIVGWIDTKVLNKIVDGLGVSVVVFAKFISLIDGLLVDGLVRLLGRLAMVFGDITRRIQSRFVQTQLIWLLLGIIFILIYILFS
jgi:NADH-quinone oxidoreductase subunit L